MKSIHLFLLLAALSSPVLANDVDPNGFDKLMTSSSRTRAEVYDDVLHARDVGAIAYGAFGYLATDDTYEYGLGAKSRAEVLADLAVVRASGGINYGEGYDPIAPQPE